ncbi:hypothetical protein RJT34_26157 [Clitoria ternatea]|uniref:Uncharacterized protein n=1 Tax=Clitoria ternatea TaxID=43366 RepID=A0AAN9I7U9_CLITE
MKVPSAILKSLSSRRIQPAAVAPLPAATRFNRYLAAELNTLQSQGNIGLVQVLDAAITTQKIALNSLLNISCIDDVERGVMEEYLENNIDILDACNFFVDTIEGMKKNYGGSLRNIVERLVGANALAPALDQLESCDDLEKKFKTMKKCGFGLRRLKLGHESEFSEVLCGSKVMALMCCKFLELGLSLDSKSGLPLMKKWHPTSFSWLRMIHEMVEEAEGKGGEKRKRRSGSLVMNELKQMVSAVHELKEQIKGKREKDVIRSGVERLKRSSMELEDKLGVIEGKVKDLYKTSIDVRMALLGILSFHS